MKPMSLSPSVKSVAGERAMPQRSGVGEIPGGESRPLQSGGRMEDLLRKEKGMKKDVEKTIRKFFESDEIARFTVISIKDLNELVLENRKTQQVETFEGLLYSLKLKGENLRGLITGKDNLKFALCYDSKGRAAFGLDDFQAFLGFPNSCAKFMALAVKADKAVIFLYDSSAMDRVFMLGVTGAKKTQNLTNLYKIIENLGFCQGEPNPYAKEMQEKQSDVAEAGDKDE